MNAIADPVGSVLVVSVGSLGQHSYHLSTSKNSLLYVAFAHRGAECASDDFLLLIRPQVRTGFSGQHIGIGGTVSLQIRHLMSLLENAS